MSHFAQVIDGIVTQVIVAEQSFINNLPDADTWIQTSYNTRGGIHYAPNSNIPDDGIPLRANYAGVGYIYDAENDVFYTKRPIDRNKLSCDSWTISAPSWLWTPPTPMPNLTQEQNESGAHLYYSWDEPTKSWISNI